MERLIAETSPVAWFDRLREASPIVWHPESSSWIVTRYDDVAHLLRDDRLGARSIDDMLQRLSPSQLVAIERVESVLSRWPIFQDSPQHHLLRAVVEPLFRRPNLAKVSIARPAAGEPLSRTVKLLCGHAIAQLLDLPPETFHQLAEWSTDLLRYVSMDDFDQKTVDIAEVAVVKVLDLVEEVLRHGPGAFASNLAELRAAGQLTLADAAALYTQLITGAIDPTAAVIARAAEVLGNDTSRWDDLERRPYLFVDEACRLTTPFHLAPRRALCDISWAGELIPSGSRVVLCLLSANRDPRVFANPNEFRLDRPRCPHLAFGRGAHRCVGVGMVRQLAPTVLAALRPLITKNTSFRWHMTVGMTTLASETCADGAPSP